MPYTYTLTAKIPATPEEIYDAWLDSIGHSEMTGSDATMSDQVGAAVSAWEGYISGRNLELVPAERIVQTWRTTNFSDDQEDSIITIVLEEADGGTLLTLEHSNVPDEQTNYENGGWQSNYFEPMIAYFSESEVDVEEAAPPRALREPEPREPAPSTTRSSTREPRTPAIKRTTKKRTAKSAARKVVKPAAKARKVKRVAGAAKKKRPATRAKPASKTKSARKAKARATPSRKAATPAKRKTGRGRR
jgi:uncharacterized protein YndB with AHSA1/START domain